MDEVRKSDSSKHITPRSHLVDSRPFVIESLGERTVKLKSISNGVLDVERRVAREGEWRDDGRVGLERLTPEGDIIADGRAGRGVRGARREKDGSADDCLVISGTTPMKATIASGLPRNVPHISRDDADR